MTGRTPTGLGRPLRSIAHGDPNVPFFTASITPAGLRTAGEVADGNLPIFFSPDAPEVVTGPTLEGRKKAGKTMEGFDTAPYVRAKMGPDVAACRDAIRPELALYIGGMGARSKNFYNDMVSKMGFEADAKVIQDLYLDGKKNEAAAAVPDALIDAISLVGPAERIRDRLQAWKAVAKDGHVGTTGAEGRQRGGDAGGGGGGALAPPRSRKQGSAILLDAKRYAVLCRRHPDRHE